MIRQKSTVIAHRGASSLAPENTASAISQALELGADWVEVDCRLTRDGTWVLIHDSHIDRRSQGRGRVEALTLDELRQYEFGAWFDPAFEGEPILTLGEACDLVLPKASLILDIKTKADPGLIARTLARALAGRDPEKILLSSFSIAVLHRLRKLPTPFLLGCLFKRQPVWRTWLAGRLGLYSIHPHRSVFSRDLARRAHAQGMKVFVWTVNRAADMTETARQGADGFFTDFPQRARRVPA